MKPAEPAAWGAWRCPRCGLAALSHRALGCQAPEIEATKAGAQLVIPGAERRNVAPAGKRAKPQQAADGLPLFGGIQPCTEESN